MDEKQKESYYMNIPATVWNSKLRANAKLCYGHITVLANKKGYCWGTNKYFAESLGVSRTSVSQYISELVELGVIRTEIILQPDSKEVKERRIYLTSMGIKENFNSPTKENCNGGIKDNFKGNTTSNNTTSNNTNTVYDDIYNKLIKDWPKIRIHSKNPVIKYLRTRSKEDITLILKNKPRYLKANEGYVKNLRNYLEHEDWSESSIKEYETKRNVTNKNNKPNTKTFKSEYDNIN